MTVFDPILFLVDLTPLALKRKNLDLFFSMDELVASSFSIAPEAKPRVPEDKQPNDLAPFAMAARMNRNNYDDQARAEALISAIKKIRATHAAKKQDPRVIRGS